MAPNDSESGDKSADATPPPSYFSQDGGTEPDVISSADPSTTATDSSYDAESQTTSLSEVDAGWTEFFPFDEPYTDQVDGINAYVDSLATHDNMVMEGACGTGKTLVGLTAGIHYLRNHAEIADTVNESAPEYSRIFAATPVKQQLKQFIEEMKTINGRLEGNPALKTTVMRGLSDMHPYSYVDYHPFDDQPVTAKIDDLRTKTVELIKFGSNIPLNWPEEVKKPLWSDYSYNWDMASEEAEEVREEFRFDPYRARAVVKTLQSEVQTEADSLIVDGVVSPFPDGIPHTTQVADATRLQEGGANQIPTDAQGRFDPFYAGYFARENLPFWFADMDDSVADAEALFEEAVQHGVCPHQAMADMGEHADVIIGNYYHVFDPDTRLLTDMKMGVLDGETLCILDEAHNIEEKVRDILSDSCGIQSFRIAKNDLRTARGYVTGDIGKLPASEQSAVDAEDVKFEKTNAEAIFTQPAYKGRTDEDIGEAIELLGFLEQQLKKIGTDHLSERFDNGWEFVVNNRRSWVENESVSLDEPESETVDELTELIEAEYGSNIWQRVYQVGQAAAHVLDEMPEVERQVECEAVGEFFYRWATSSHVEYFREAVLEESFKDSPLAASHGWTEAWTPKYQLYNCIPTEVLRELFSELGSVLLMSATLEPLDEFITTSGADRCISPATIDDKEERAAAIRSGEADASSDMPFRDVTVRQYPLRFPEANRESFIVSAPKFTYSNRGSPTTSPRQMTDARETYADLVTDIASSQGNILICLPSYGEATWAEDVLNQDPISQSKQIILDQSSSSAETDRTLDSFFDGGDGVLLTSNRGTVTEGVDYDGEKLHTCAVIGLSLLPPTDRNKATEAAYDEYVGDVSGFEATNAIPAVRKARQAIGRVIRGSDEVGTRIFVDERYADEGWSGVNAYLSEQEQGEFRVTRPERLSERLDAFWQRQ